MTAEPKKRWHTPDFELRFKKAMGRDMTPEEREFFGLDCADSKESQESDTQPNSNRSEYAWQALRRISALMG